IFINLLKLIAIPLILVSLIKGLVDLQDISKFKVMGIRTFLVYVSTTIIAVSIGLLMVNIIMPGDSVSPDTIAQLTGQAESDMKVKIDNAATSTTSGPLQFLVDMVPDNFFKAASGNSNMLQVIFFAIFFGISLLLVDKKVGQPVIDFFNGLNEVIMKMVDLIMLMAPYAVFALLSALIVEITNPDLFIALIWYMVTVLLGLILMILFYALVVYLYVKKSPLEFYKAIAPAQLLAFSTSSSAATLPVTMERVEEHLGVDKEVSSFVCPLGATINMDGTSLYQAVAAVFICEALNFELTFAAQLTIILTATLASIGSAAVPGAGLIMLVVVLESLDLPAESMAIGLALIFAVDRPLDMCRTIVNITGDCMVALVIGKSLNKIHTPKPKEWNDNYAA
ncbi:MAG TPA: dicarboxylate/amino acid:cation symporter, partial [Saprospiraceae bacterium]|nr:dicarboxylate/amino acid:cation symporter [Saprospiraceae bacterium]